MAGSNQTISAGGGYSLVIDQRDRIWSFGSGSYGRLGLGGSLGHGWDFGRDRPEKITKFTGASVRPLIIAVSTGDDHSLVLDESGQVWSFGNNIYGQLGSNDRQNWNRPNRISLFQGLDSPPTIVAISAGYRHSLLLDQQGRVWSFGFINDGRLGLGDIDLENNRNSRNQPIQISIFQGLDAPPMIVAISAGSHHSLLLDQQGRVWSFGRNRWGQLGLGDETNRSRPELIPDLPPIVAISAGFNHSLLLDDQGRVWSFGFNRDGMLGLGDETITNNDNEEEEVIIGVDHNRNRPELITIFQGSALSPLIIAISAGIHNLLLDDQGKIWSFGRNSWGQLGLGDVTIYREEGEIEVIIGVNHNRNRPELITIFQGSELPPSIVAISAGYNHSLVVDQQGQVWGFGQDVEGQLGLGRYTSNEGEEETRPKLIPGLIAKLPTVELTADQPFILTIYPVIQQLFERQQVVDFRIRSDGVLDNTDTMLEFENQDGIVYLARVQYDRQNDQILPPLKSVTFFETLELFIQTNQLKEYQFRPDLYQDSQGNQGFEFKDPTGQISLIRVYVDPADGQIYPPQ